MPRQLTEWESSRLLDELRAICQQHGFTSDHTEELLGEAIASIMIFDNDQEVLDAAA